MIPADLRREFGIKAGDSLVIERAGGGGLSVKTFTDVVREEQQRFRAIADPIYTLDTFLAERRADWGEDS